MTGFDGKTITIDPSDWKGMLQLMTRHEEFKTPWIGKNENNERVLISVNRDNITVETWQSNGHVRQNSYWDDFRIEEIFEGRWDK